MRRTPHFLLNDVHEVKRLIRGNPWATIVSTTANGMVASHYPVVLEDDTGESISLLSHVGRPDEQAHELGRHEVMVIIQGPHGYISPSWYPEGQFVPTWNHVTAHLWGIPEILADEENFRVLERLVDLFETGVAEPRSLRFDEQAARQIAKGTVGLRLRVTRFDARAKLSQDKPHAVVSRIIEELEAGTDYANPTLAKEMRRFSAD
jgi:transcriptional regulator